MARSSSGLRHRGVVLGIAVLLSAVMEGCNRPAAPPAITTTPAPRSAHKTLMLKIEFASAEAAKVSPEILKDAMQGIATVENGPFLQGGTPFVRFAVSIAPTESPDPVLRKVRTVAGVKDVTIVRF